MLNQSIIMHILWIQSAKYLFACNC